MLNISAIRKVNEQSVSYLARFLDMQMHGEMRYSAKESLSFALIYAAYICKENGFTTENMLKDFIAGIKNESRRLFLNECLKGMESIAIETANKFEKEVLLAYLYRFSLSTDTYLRMFSEHSTPLSLIKLAEEILAIDSTDYVADFGCGYGDFLILTNEISPKSHYYGVEIHNYSKEIAAIRSELFIDDGQIEMFDMFRLNPDRKFNKIFSNYPFGMRVSNSSYGREYLEKFKTSEPDINTITSMDWIYNRLLLDHLSDRGTAVSIMTNGSTWNSTDKQIRRYFVENGFIRCMISLPPRMFSMTNISTTMIVLGYHNDNGIRMVDARDIFTAGRRNNEFSDEDIQKIMAAVNDNGKLSRLVPIEDIRNNEYILNPARYTEKKIYIKNGEKFDTVIKRITRGAPFKASELDEMTSQKRTNIQYLMLSNIQNGFITENLPYLKSLDSKYDKYRIRKGNLLLSKNGAPFKVAVAEFEDDVKVIGNGNLYIIDLDENKINPYYLKAFFESEEGILSLKRIAVGASMPNIAVESLKAITVPVPPLDEQQKVVTRYLAKQDEIKILQLKLREAQNDLKNIFAEE